MFISLILFFSGAKAALYDKDNVDWVPTLRMGHSKIKPLTPSALARKERAKGRQSRCVAEINSFSQEDIDAAETLCELSNKAGTHIEEIVQPSTILIHDETQTEWLKTEVGVQTDVTGDFLDKLYAYSLETNEELYRLRDQAMNKQETDSSTLEKDNERVKYYTGLPSFALLIAVFDLVAPYMTHSSISTF